MRTDAGVITQTDRGYTGQRNDYYIKLLDYCSRWYDPLLKRFISPDSIIPNPANSQSWNRYAYVLGNPIRFNDPSGHIPVIDDDSNGNPIVNKNWKKRNGSSGRRGSEIDFLGPMPLPYLPPSDYAYGNPPTSCSTGRDERLTRMEISDDLMMNWDTIQTQYILIAASQLQYHTKAYGAISWDDGGRQLWLKEYHLAQMGLWYAILDRENSPQPWASRAVVDVNFPAVEKATMRAKANGLFVKNGIEQTDSQLDLYDTDNDYSPTNIRQIPLP